MLHLRRIGLFHFGRHRLFPETGTAGAKVGQEGGDQHREPQDPVHTVAVCFPRGLFLPFLQDRAHRQGRIVDFIDVDIGPVIDLRLEHQRVHPVLRVAVPEIQVDVLGIALGRDREGHLLETRGVRTELEEGESVQVGQEVEIAVRPVVHEILAGDEIPERRLLQVPDLPDGEIPRIDSIKVIVVLGRELLLPGRIATAAEHIQKRVHDVGGHGIARRNLFEDGPPVQFRMFQIADDQLVPVMIVPVAPKAVKRVDFRLPGIRIVPVVVVAGGNHVVVPTSGGEIEGREQAFVQVERRQPVVVAGHVEHLVGIVRGIVAAGDGDFREIVRIGMPDMDGLVPVGHVKTVVIVEGDRRDVLERMREHRPERDVLVDEPLRVLDHGRGARLFVVADVAGMAGQLPLPDESASPPDPDVAQVHGRDVAERVARELAQAESDPESLRPLGAGVPELQQAAAIVHVHLPVLGIQGNLHRNPFLQRNRAGNLVDLVPRHQDRMTAVVQVHRVHQVDVLAAVGQDAEDAAEHVVRPVVDVEREFEGIPSQRDGLSSLEGHARIILRGGRIGNDGQAIFQRRGKGICPILYGLRPPRPADGAGENQRSHETASRPKMSHTKDKCKQFQREKKTPYFSRRAASPASFRYRSDGTPSSSGTNSLRGAATGTWPAIL